MPGLPYTQTRQDTPESMLDNYLQQGLQDIQQRFEVQWNEVNSRASVLGERKQMELLNELQAKATQEVIKFQQGVSMQQEQLALMDRLAQQNPSFDAEEVKRRMTLGPEAEAEMFPTEQDPMAQYGKLDVYQRRLESDMPEFMTVPGKRTGGLTGKVLGAGGFGVPGAVISRFISKGKRKPTQLIYDPDLDPTYDEKTGKWTVGDYRPATPEELQQKTFYESEIADVKRTKQEIMGLPDVATRIRGAMLRVKREPEHTSFAEKVQGSKPVPTEPRRQKVIRQRNKRTGQERISYDGGKSWQMVSG